MNNKGNAGFGSFFRYHGWLSPGVRLFRSIGFRAKSTWISIMFCVPLVTMVGLLWSSANDQVETARSEQQGIAFVEAVSEFVHAATLVRHAAVNNPGELSASQSRAQTALAAMETRNKEFGAAFGTNDAFEAVKKSHQSLSQKPVLASADETYAAHTKVVGAGLGLIDAIANGSQLALDPDLDTYHLMNMSVILGPKYSTRQADLRTLGFLSLKEKSVPPKRKESLQKALVLMEAVEEDIEASFAKGITAFPDVAKSFDMKGVDDIREPFMKALEKQVLGDAVAGEPETLLNLGAATVERELAFDKQVRARLDSRLQERIDRLHATVYRNILISIFFVALALYLMLAFYKVMMGGLSEVAGHLGQITKGNLTTAPRPWGSDEAAQLMVTLGDMQASLRRIVGIVLESSAGVQTASEEIASASHDLARRTESSAASLEQTASAMEEISSTVQHTSDTVTSANAIVRENAGSATRGGAVISQVVVTMDGIRASSNKIGEIISVIDGIAFQTNILALNAAVEAARAGEQGRGFAVVATEVRALAGRSAAAAKEIKTLISASIDQVQTGNQVVAEAGTTIGEIVANAGKIDAMMSEIATATREQSEGVKQVSQAVHALDEGTQQNAALVEQTAASASSLAEQAQRLADEVSFFKMS